MTDHDELLVERWASLLEDARTAMYLAEWLFKDIPKDIMDDGGEILLRKVAAHPSINTGWRNLARAARLAAHYPPEERDLAFSPRTHATWMKETK